MAGEGERTAAALRRIDDLVTGLDRIADPVARERSRDLLQTVLDLHGLALARLTALAAGAPDGGQLLARFGADPVVRPVLLLYGLHPEDLETRLRKAAARLEPALTRSGASADIVVRPGRGALVRVSGAPEARTALEDLRGEIEAVLLEAAPELETLDVEVLEPRSPSPAAAE